MGFWGIGKMAFYFWRTREQMPPFAGNRGTKALLGNREHKMFFSSIFKNMGRIQRLQESTFWSEPSSTCILHVCEKQRLW